MNPVFVRGALAKFALSCFAVGQCPLQWLPGEPIPSVEGDAYASTVWDADGPGPAPAVLVVGGRFGAGAMLETSLAAFDGTDWLALGTPPMPEVAALTTWNGLLVAAGGAGLQHVVATWNGTTWSVIGNPNGPVRALAVFNGALFAGGSFLTMNGQLMHNLAQWNGAAWSEPGGGVTGTVRSMTVFGSLYVGGALTQAGPLPVGNLALWNGTSWSAGPVFDAPVRSLAARMGTTVTNSFVFVGGEFTTVGGISANRVARFAPATNAWTALPGLTGSVCRALHVRNTSTTTFQLHAAVDTGGADKVWRWSGTAWQSLGPVSDFAVPTPTSLAFFNGRYVGTFEADSTPSSTLTKAVRIHDGTGWLTAAGPGFDGQICAVAPFGNDIVVGGTFRAYGQTPFAAIARGRPGAWQPLGSGMAGGDGVLALCTSANGDLVAAGNFTTAGGVAASSIARWDGTQWLPLGTGIAGDVRALVPLPDGGLIAGGVFSTAGGIAVANVAQWNGTTWSSLGGGMDAAVMALARRANGDILAAGSFTTADGIPAARIARWNGTTWSALGSGLDATGFALAVLPDDSVVVGGTFTLAGGVFTPKIARWNGSVWSAQSASAIAWDAAVEAIVALPNGDYMAGGQQSSFGSGGFSTDANLARHSGGTASLQWDPLDLHGFSVRAAAVMPNGDLVFGGSLDAAGGAVSHNLAVLRPTCPAAAVVYGSGCTGSGGVNVLTATSLPWTGSTFRARATGMPATGIVLAMTGFTQLAVPMSAVLPQGVAGCTALVSPDLLDLSLPSAGVATTQLAVPASVALAAQVFHHQVVSLQTDVAGNLLAITGTNGLVLTIGTL